MCETASGTLLTVKIYDGKGKFKIRKVLFIQRDVLGKFRLRFEFGFTQAESFWNTDIMGKTIKSLYAKLKGKKPHFTCQSISTSGGFLRFLSNLFLSRSENVFVLIALRMFP